MVPLRLGHQNIEPRTKNKKGMRKILASDCEAPIRDDWRGHQRPPPFHPIEREGRAFGFFMLSKSLPMVFRVVKELNNENRWRMPDRIDRVM